MRFPIPCVNTWNIKSQFSAAPLSLPLSFYTSRGDNGLHKLQSFSVPDHWEFHWGRGGAAPHKGWPRRMLMAPSSELWTSPHAIIWCVTQRTDETRRKQFSQEFSKINNNSSFLTDEICTHVYVFTRLWAGKRRQAPN